MAIHHGYITVPHSTYIEWRTNTLGEGYDADGVYPCECWDYCAIFWYSVGYPQGYPITQTGGNGQAWMCWTYSRDINKQYNGTTYFDLIYNLSEVQAGDVVVLNGTTSNPAGHIAFADENYDGSGYLWCIGQNQGGTPLPGGGTLVTRNRLGMGDFLGAFRYRAWHTTPPTPTVYKKRFPWVIYMGKLRNEREL